MVVPQHRLRDCFADFTDHHQPESSIEVVDTAEREMDFAEVLDVQMAVEQHDHFAFFLRFGYFARGLFPVLHLAQAHNVHFQILQTPCHVSDLVCDVLTRGGEADDKLIFWTLDCIQRRHDIVLGTHEQLCAYFFLEQEYAVIEPVWSQYPSNQRDQNQPDSLVVRVVVTDDGTFEQFGRVVGREPQHLRLAAADLVVELLQILQRLECVELFWLVE